MKGLIPTFAACLALTCIGGCAHTGAGSLGPTGEPLDAYMPLAVGNSWTYATFFQGNPQAELTVELVGKKGPFFLDNRPQQSQLVFDAEGLRDGNKRYLLKAPLVQGTKWMSVADIKTVEHFEITDVSRKVSVPAGVFENCVVVQMEVRINQKRAMQNIMTYAPGVGIVEISTMLLDGSRILPQSRLVLKKFALSSSRKEAP